MNHTVGNSLMHLPIKSRLLSFISNLLAVLLHNWGGPHCQDKKTWHLSYTLIVVVKGGSGYKRSKKKIAQGDGSISHSEDEWTEISFTWCGSETIHGISLPTTEQSHEPRPGQGGRRAQIWGGVPNNLWRSDSMHGPKIEREGRMRETYLLADLIHLPGSARDLS